MTGLFGLFIKNSIKNNKPLENNNVVMLYLYFCLFYFMLSTKYMDYNRFSTWIIGYFFFLNQNQ